MVKILPLWNSGHIIVSYYSRMKIYFIKAIFILYTPLSLWAIKNDIQVAKLFVDIHKQLEQEKIKSKDVYLAIKKINKESPFRFFLPHLKKILSLSKEKRLYPTIKRCSFVNEKKLISHFFYEEIKIYCHKRILKLLIKNKLYHKLRKNALAYLEKNIRFYLSDENIKAFLTYIEKTKRSSSLHLSLSKIISNAYLQYGGIIHPETMSSIHVDSNLSSYVTIKHFISLKEKEFFQEDFIKIQKDINNNLKNKRFIQAQHNADFLLNLYRRNSMFTHTEEYKNLFILAKNFTRKKLFGKSNDIYQYIFDMSPEPFKEDALSEKLINFIRNKEYTNAVKNINGLKLLENFDSLNSRSQYWIAHSIKKYGNTDLSNTLYKKIINQHPISFYSIIAFKKNLALFKQYNNLVKKEKIAKNNFILKEKDKEIWNMSERIKIWLSIGDTTLLSKDVDSMFQYIIDKPRKFGPDEIQFIALYLIDIFNKKSNYLYTFQLIYKLLENNYISFNDIFLRLLFPSPYFAKVKKYSLGIDPYLILSIMRQESSFNPKALSKAGARGLMQLMPATEKRFSKRTPTSWSKRKDLNIKIGITYLDYLFKKYNGDLIYTLASYNAGENWVKKWQKEILNNKDPLIQIESIPYRETRNYIKLIYRNLFFYKYLANENKFLTKDINKSFIFKR